MAAEQKKRAGHTAAQRSMLVLSILVILACFAGAAVLLWAKYEREQFQALDAIAPIERPAGDATPGAPPETQASPTPESSVPGESTPSEPAEAFPAADPDAKNYLIAAADNHACVDQDSPWWNAAAPNRPANDRSDSIMVIRVDPRTRAAAVLSFPRDLYITRPGGGKGRINAMYSRNDHTRLIATIDKNFGVPVDHYVQVDFCAFKTIVDAVGGVSVPFATPIQDPNVQLSIPEAGCHEFSGDEALAYVRSRHLQQYVNGKWVEDAQADFGRISRQQDFLTRTMRSALSKGTFNMSVARGLLRTFQNGDLITDQGFSIDEILGLAGLLRDINPESLLRYQVDGKGRTIQGDWVLIPEKSERMEAVFDIFRGKSPLIGADIPEPPATDPTTDPATTDPATTDATAVPETTTSSTPSTDPSTAPAVSTPASQPEQIVKGNILPDPTVICP